MTRYTLRLQPEPRAASDARRWVGSMCVDLGYDDLAACAQLGASELVTNALLHAAVPIAVGVATRADTLRVEVSDGSPQIPVLIAPPVGADPLSTVGRGLTILSRCATAWGARVGATGKTVWFEPETEPREDGPPVGGVVDWSDAVAAPSPRGFAIVEIRNLPAADFADLEVHYHGLKRELRLLSLDRARDGGLAREFTRRAAEFDALFEPGTAPGSAERIGEANRDALSLDSLDEGHIDLRTTIGTDAPEVIHRMMELFDRANEFARDQRLLALALTPRQRELQRWFVGELSRQARGLQPRSWPGYVEGDPAVEVAAASEPVAGSAAGSAATSGSAAAVIAPVVPAPSPLAGT